MHIQLLKNGREPIVCSVIYFFTTSEVLITSIPHNLIFCVLFSNLMWAFRLVAGADEFFENTYYIWLLCSL